MTQHTPGPWKITKSWHDFMVEGPNGEEIIWQDGNYDTPTIKLEDAQLIAAAPDLLAMLVEAANFIQPYSVGQELLERIDAAIAKATGEK
jgi:hypothetical protein